MYHLCACLIRNLFDEQEKNDNDEMYSTIFGSEEINDKTKSLALEVVKHQTHIVDQLLIDAGKGKFLAAEMVPLVWEVTEMLLPLFSFMSCEPTLPSIEELCSTLPNLLNKLYLTNSKDFLVTSVKRLHEKVKFSAWCLRQLSIQPSWTPKKLLKLCIRQSSDLNSLKLLGGLHLGNEVEICLLLADDPLSLDIFKGFAAVIKFIYFLFKCFRRIETGTSLEEIDNLLEGINQTDLCIQIMEDIFSLIFLRREDVLFEETASESGEGGELAETLEFKKGSVQCPSTSNSPNSQSHTGTSSSSLAEKKDNISLGFLCQDPDKLKISLLMLKRRIEALKIASHLAPSIRLNNLEKYVNQALWRLQLLEGDLIQDDRSSTYFSHSSGVKSVRKAWVARLSSYVQSWFGNSPNRRRPRMKSLQIKKTWVNSNPLLINRILAQPTSLMVMSMMKLQLDNARQVADLHRLWDTAQGKELEYSLNHLHAVEDLQRAISTRQMLPLSSSADPIDNIIIEGLNHLAIPSAVETILSTFLQKVLFGGSINEEQTAVVSADLILSTSSTLPLVHAADILAFALERMAVNLHVEPWKTLKRLVQCFQQLTEVDSTYTWTLPIRTHLPLDAHLLRKHMDDRCRLNKELEHFLQVINNDFSNLDIAFLPLDETLRSIHPSQQSHYLVCLGYYIQLLRQLIGPQFQNQSALSLLECNAGDMIMKRLSENHYDIEIMEIPSRLLGIELPCFIARSFWSSCNPRNNEFTHQLLLYLESKCRLLAQVVDLQLHTQHGVPLMLSTDCSCSMDVFHRYLQRLQRTVIPVLPKQDTSPKRRPCPVQSLKETEPHFNTDSPDVIEDIVDPTPLILAMIPKSQRVQLEHLVTCPLLMIEQLLMNSQFALASDLIQGIRQDSSEQNCSDIEEVLLCYASKALALGLPEVDEESMRVHSHPLKHLVRNKSTAFILPATAPTKEHWVSDAQVTQCPCCQTIQFSMFNRRHHCRRCGRVVCSGCSPYRQLVEGYGDVPVRTCVDCTAYLETPKAAFVRSASQNGTILWTLSLEPKHNEIVRREFSYEHAPNLAVALAIVHLCHNSENVANFLLDQSSVMLVTLHRYLLNGAMFEVDPIIMLQLIKTLILTSKMRFSEIIASPTEGKPSRGLARCDALLGQIDLLSLLASANCLHLLPPQALSQLDTWRKLRDRLIEIELWSLALDVTTKAGLDAGPVWAAWGLVCLKAGNFQGARQRFQRCLKVGKTSPLLQEIVSVLENLNVAYALSHPTLDNKNRKLSTSPKPQIVSDKPELVISSLARLNDICRGKFIETDKTDKNFALNEVLFYLESYANAESPYAYLIERMGRIDMAVQRFFVHINDLPTDVFNTGLVLPCMKSSHVENLVTEMKRYDSSFREWKMCLLSAAHLLEMKCLWNTLYQLYCLTGDHIRACLVAIRRLYLADLFSIESLVSRTELLEDSSNHLVSFLAKQALILEAEDRDEQVALWWPKHEVLLLKKTIDLQLKITAFLNKCYREEKLPDSLLGVIKSVTQPTGSSSDNTGTYLIPTVLGSRQERCFSAVLVTVSSPDCNGFELSWRICTEHRLRLDRYFRLSAFVLIKRNRVAAVVHLIDFLQSRMTADSVGFFEIEQLLVDCASLTQERDKENKTHDTEIIVQLIKQPTNKIRVFINLGWLKAAYLLAVKNGQISDVIHIQQEATRLNHHTVLTLCNKWLSARKAIQ